jgi:hypothetical protein
MLKFYVRRVFFIGVFLLSLSGCSCDPVCEAGKETRSLLGSYSDSLEVVAFLNKYNGEGPGFQKFSEFVIWGAKHPMKVKEIMSHSDLQPHILDSVIYSISDMGLSSEYCQIYNSDGDSEFAKEMRNRILGCIKRHV